MSSRIFLPIITNGGNNFCDGWNLGGGAPRGTLCEQALVLWAVVRGSTGELTAVVPFPLIG
jgi:hypothetical protein